MCLWNTLWPLRMSVVRTPLCYIIMCVQLHHWSWFWCALQWTIRLLCDWEAVGVHTTWPHHSALQLPPHATDGSLHAPGLCEWLVVCCVPLVSVLCASGLCVVCLWSVCCVPLVSVLCASGQCVVCLWSVCCVPLVSVLCASGLCVVCLWSVCCVPLVSVLCASGLCVVCLWSVCCVLLVCVNRLEHANDTVFTTSCTAHISILHLVHWTVLLCTLDQRLKRKGYETGITWTHKFRQSVLPKMGVACYFTASSIYFVGLYL